MVQSATYRLGKEYIELLNEGAISFEDLEEFSEELKETIGVFIGRGIGDIKF